jgi:hypothetical protein
MGQTRESQKPRLGNGEIAEKLREIAGLLEGQGANPFQKAPDMNDQCIGDCSTCVRDAGPDDANLRKARGLRQLPAEGVLLLLLVVIGIVGASITASPAGQVAAAVGGIAFGTCLIVLLRTLIRKWRT